MEFDSLGPTPRQVAELDQRLSEIASLGRVLGSFRESLVATGFSGDEAFRLASRLFEVMMIQLVEQHGDG